ncbi:MAG: D-alanyl-D-alanine carboxypeptidase [Actinobacteria bacterium]|nr:D-alanyl-D-alanine carboxypeptidase [Actinomycetota bacterium]
MSPRHRTSPSSRHARRWLGGTVAAGLVVLCGPGVAPSVAVVPPAAPLAAPRAVPASVPVVAPAAPLAVPLAADAPLPDPAILTARLKKVSTKGIQKVGVVVTTTDGQVLADRSSGTPLTPASTMKLFTTMAALDALGPERTFATRVVDADGKRIVLVGGGDPLLTDKTSTSSYKTASLQKLAAATVAALRAAGRTSVGLRYDASLFTGPTFSPDWKSKWLGWEARVAALEINSGKVSGGRAASNPPKTAAKAFAARLRAAGITVTSILPATAPAGATELARVTSTTTARIVHRTLLLSDNVAAETLSRHAALANGRAGSFTGAAANVTAWAADSGLWVTGQRILDGSGLAPGSRLAPAALAAAVRLALAEDRFAPVIGGLPVAAESGTLRHRFDDRSEAAGRHVVHAKTGTLSGLAGLAGYVTTADGALLVFAELGNKATSYYRVYDWLDREAAVIAGCGCR